MQIQPHKSQHGSALILVLWVSLLLSLILVGIITVSRSDLRTTKAREKDFLADNAAKAALETVAFEISTNRDQNFQFNRQTLTINGLTVIVEKSDEAKKLDLNLASETELTRYFKFLGEEDDTSIMLAANIADWRDNDNIARPNGAERRDYVRARVERRPANRPFDSIGELKNVLGITDELAKCAISGLTIFGIVDGPSPSFLSRLYNKSYPQNQRQQSTTSLGTAARVSNAGARYSLIAKVSDNNENDYIFAHTLGVFRATGNIQAPYQWIAMIPKYETQVTIDCAQRS